MEKTDKRCCQIIIIHQEKYLSPRGKSYFEKKMQILPVFQHKKSIIEEISRDQQKP